MEKRRRYFDRGVGGRDVQKRVQIQVQHSAHELNECVGQAGDVQEVEVEHVAVVAVLHAGVECVVHSAVVLT